MPEKPQEELETLVEIADALRKSEVDIDPKLKENLEAKVLDNIVQVADENPDYNHDLYHFISEESDYEEDATDTSNLLWSAQARITCDLEITAIKRVMLTHD